MYCVVYEFTIKPGCAPAFEASWGAFTEAIRRVRHGLGSRLHRTADERMYVAYAQWPSKETFEQDAPADAYTSDELAARELMLRSLETTKRVYFLEMCDDRLSR